ncbi:MAG: hypothetical protein JRJ14_08630 [Deltaproteobacteria bacterium]|nr:hypothetical protein [Deltaproteobacteria bacterium]
MKHNASCQTIFLSIITLLVLSGCSSFGSRNIPRDRFDYNEAIAQSHNQQMLLNIVRFRYLEIPNFLAVSSVITSYAYDGSVGLSGTSNATPSNEIITGNANLGYAEKPTITYAPLAGQEFAIRLLKNISVEGIFSLGHAGFPMDILMAIGLHRINDVKNMGFGGVPAPGEVDIDKQFMKESQDLTNFGHVLNLLLTLEEKGVLEARRIKNGEKEYTQLHFSTDISPAMRKLVTELKATLNLDPNLNAFRVTSRTTGRDKDEITIQSRSLLAMMGFLGRGVMVPPEDEEAKKVVVFPESAKKNILAHAPLKIYSQKEVPVDPFVAIKYRDYWFYIDRTDTRSKRTFGTMLVLFQLQAPSQGTQAPLLTLPAG